MIPLHRPHLWTLVSLLVKNVKPHVTIRSIYTPLFQPASDPPNVKQILFLQLCSSPHRGIHFLSDAFPEGRSLFRNIFHAGVCRCQARIPKQS